MEGLTEGRMVHYILAERVHVPAIIVRVVDRDQGVVNLCVFADTEERIARFGSATVFRHGVPFAQAQLGQEASWHWIERA